MNEFESESSKSSGDAVAEPDQSQLLGEIDPSVAKELNLQKPSDDPALLWWTALLGPFVATLVLLGFVYVTQGWQVAASYVGAATTAFFLFGRFIILLGAEATSEQSKFEFLQYLNARNLFVMLTWLDVMTAIFVAFHMAILFRIPWVGKKMEDLVEDGKFILERQPWIRNVAFGGLIAFVIFPSSTTGSIGGSIFGRLMGMSRLRTVIAILIGSVVGNGIMLLFAKQINRILPSDSIGLKLVGVGAMIFVLFLFERWIRRSKRQYEAQHAADESRLGQP